MARLTQLEGIGSKYQQKLVDAGISTTEHLLEQGAKPKGRKDLAARTGISDKLVLRWVNMADIFRIKGIGEEYSDLLEASGVDTVPELAQRKATSLQAKMVEVNVRKKLVRQIPGELKVSAWISQAKKLPRVVKY